MKTVPAHQVKMIDALDAISNDEAFPQNVRNVTMKAATYIENRSVELWEAAERAEKYEKALQDIATSPEPDASLSDAEKAAMTDCEACARVQARGSGEWRTMCPACYERIRRRDDRTKEMRQMWAWGLKVKASSALSNPPAQGETQP